MTKLNLFSEAIYDGEELEYFSEASGKGKEHYIEGIFAQADIINNNRRLYPSKVLMPQIESYIETKVKKNLAVGELDHPETMAVMHKNVSHLITDLKIEGSNVIGKAKLAHTPSGDIAKGLLETGVKLSVSTRGAGKTKKKTGYEEMELYYMSTIDIVSFPGAPDAFVKGVNESIEFLVENGHLKMSEADKIKQSDDLTGIEFKKAVRRIFASL